jgi:hypothetical protein
LKETPVAIFLNLVATLPSGQSPEALLAKDDRGARRE